jgi:hypothetical protein
MAITRTLTAAAAVSGIALAAAACPAWEDEGFGGTYLLTSGQNMSDKGAKPTWTATTTCDELTGCVSDIDSSTGWNGVAHLVGSRWTMVVPSTATCGNGSTAPVTNTYSWDDTPREGTETSSGLGGVVTLSGTETSVLENGGCGERPGSTLLTPFALTKGDGLLMLFNH